MITSLGFCVHLVVARRRRCSCCCCCWLTLSPRQWNTGFCWQFHLGTIARTRSDESAHLPRQRIACLQFFVGQCAMRHRSELANTWEQMRWHATCPIRIVLLKMAINARDTDTEGLWAFGHLMLLHSAIRHGPMLRALRACTHHRNLHTELCNIRQSSMVGFIFHHVAWWTRYPPIGNHHKVLNCQ